MAIGRHLLPTRANRLDPVDLHQPTNLALTNSEPPDVIPNLHPVAIKGHLEEWSFRRDALGVTGWRRAQQPIFGQLAGWPLLSGSFVG